MIFKKNKMSREKTLQLFVVPFIPRAVRKLEFGPLAISSRGSIDRKEVSINAILTSLRRPNPGALAQSKFQFANRSGYSKISQFAYFCRIFKSFTFSFYKA